MSDTNLHPKPDAASDSPPPALVMDDDPLFRTLLVSMLKRDYQVTAAVDGSDGFYKALERPPAVAVIDIQMPVWDGVRTIGAFRDNATLRHVPLLVLTSDASKETVLAAIAAGADDYVIKCSLSRGELLEKLECIRQRRRRVAGTWDHGQTRGVADDEARIQPSSATSERRLQAMIDSWE